MVDHPCDGGGGSRRPGRVLAVVAVGTFLSAMAGSMVNLALPTIGREMSVTVESSRWVVQSYLMVIGVLLLPCGRLSDIVGHGRLYMVGFAVFGLSSVWCATAGGLGWLVAARGLQGAGAAMVMATGPALLTTAFPDSQRGKALGTLSTATYTGLMLGPPAAGWVVGNLGWRWVFWGVLPVSALVLVLGWLHLPRKDGAERARFDWAGTAALVAGLPLLLLGLDRLRPGGDPGAASWAAGALGLVGVTGFVALQRRSASPLVDLEMFRSRVFAGAALSALANYVALFGMILLTPFYLEEGLGLSSGASGLVLAAQPAVMALVASPSGWLSDRIGSRGPATLGMLILAAGLGGLSFLGAGDDRLTVALWLGVCGLGTGIFISPNSSALMGAAPRRRQGTAGSLLAEARVLGMLIGVALAAIVFATAGGVTGRSWKPVDFDAFAAVMRISAVVAALGAATAALRGKRPS
jgi:EmrB/QacA subfamily drug resistance transporter